LKILQVSHSFHLFFLFYIFILFSFLLDITFEKNSHRLLWIIFNQLSDLYLLNTVITETICLSLITILNQMTWNNSIDWWFKFIRKSKSHTNWINIKSYILSRIFMSRRRSFTEVSWHTRNSTSSFNINREWSTSLGYYKLLWIFLWNLSINWSILKDMYLITCKI